MADELVRVGDDGVTLTLTMHATGGGSQVTRQALTRMARTLDAAVMRTDLKCVIVRSVGDHFFALGDDPRADADVRTEHQVDAMVEQCRGALDTLRDFPLPVLAVLNGDALWAGAELALACDLRLAMPHAGIGLGHARRQLTPAFGGATDLMTLVGRARALRMLTRAERLEADMALAWGLIDAILPAEDPDAGVRAFLAPLLECSSHVLRAFKAQAVAMRRGMTFHERRVVEQEGFSRVWLDAPHWQSVARSLKDRSST